VSTTEGNGGGAPAEVPAGEASPETLRRLEAALPHREASTPPPTEGAGRAVERNAVLLLALVALGIALGVVSVLALVL
jgi:hypothetical protein